MRRDADLLHCAGKNVPVLTLISVSLFLSVGLSLGASSSPQFALASDLTSAYQHKPLSDLFLVSSFLFDVSYFNQKPATRNPKQVFQRFVLKPSGPVRTRPSLEFLRELLHDPVGKSVGNRIDVLGHLCPVLCLFGEILLVDCFNLGNMMGTVGH